MLSLWADRTQLKEFPSLEEDKKTDVLVIGGGITGLLCAWRLKQAGVDCILVEADRVCGWNTGNTTAKITAQHGLCYAGLLEEAGQEQAQLYLRANLEAVKLYRRLCDRIDCHFEEKASYVYSLCDQAQIEREIRALERLGYRAGFADALKLPFSVVGAVRFDGQAQFDPLMFAHGISRELEIYEHTAIREIRDSAAVTDRDVRITAEAFVVATHFPFMNKHGLYPLKMYQQRSYCLALENAAQVDGMYIDGAQNGLSFRNEGKLLLLGGGGHRTGEPGGGWQRLRQFAGKFYPGARETCSWAAQDCMTLDGRPYIGRYAKGLPHVYTATGFGKWGMTTAMVSACLLADLIQGKENPYGAVFAPSRLMKLSALAQNGAHAAAGLLSFSKKRCPHLGCVLKWNAQEHSWDCSCHGSRFAQDGRLLDNPATGNLKGMPER